MKTFEHARSAPRLSLNARTAAELMKANPVSIRQAAMAGDAAAFLSGRGISAAPVIDEAGRPVGVVSRTDLLTHRAHRALHLLTVFGELDALPGPCRPGHARVRDVMTPVVFCVRPETAAAKVVEMMLALRVRRLFVVDGDGALVGVISALDVLRSLRPLRASGGRANGRGPSA